MAVESVLASALLVWGLATPWAGTLNPWPVAYEGVATRAYDVEAEIRSPFLSNLLVWSFEQAPRGRLFRWLAHDIYGRRLTLRYLQTEFWNRREPEQLQQLAILALRWRTETHPAIEDS